ncbi:cystathionine gamma-synthase, converts cysteine into cystathionine [Nadsonia fulvescens var. elongata DSM 6958]|uniref:cystathionine gamma-synthase n=1 Tax=Nadsonia fulvescens var. elongata DSM 6958 TaxID=857566 RepID=A0A1E3PHK2_9ASCO|nr:cystathionine gamma-synthase, converts cysteine into cystathionine [Nadsonia fulvescens var. elongata DSM 6958]
MSASLSKPPTEIGCPIPAHTPHAVSVTLPTWAANVGYEEGEDWVVSKMTSGYPRFFVHFKIKELCQWAEDIYGREGEKCFIYPAYSVARRCRDFIKQYSASTSAVRILQLATPLPATETSVNSNDTDTDNNPIQAEISIVFFPAADFSLAKQYWQHSGEGISSRFGEYCLGQFVQSQVGVSPHRALSYSQHHERNNNSGNKKAPTEETAVVDDSGRSQEHSAYLEERFGRNLNLSFVAEAKAALRRRISGNINECQKTGYSQSAALSEDDVYLYPCGMAAIFSAHRMLLGCRPNEKSVCFGFPYVDSLNILRKFGPGVHFFGMGDTSDLDAIEKLLSGGERILCLFCEFPGNPLLKSPDLVRIRKLADEYDFAVIVDETIGNFINTHVLPYADVVVSSLTKVFSGDSNVMGGSLVLNPHSRYYFIFKETLTHQYEDTFWAEDAIYLERNSRDFCHRNSRINVNTEAAVNIFLNNPNVKDVFYPKINDTRALYDQCRTPNGGYGGLLSIVFHKPENAVKFFDAVETAKGPSLGTNFTLTSPYAILAHYGELDWAEQYGVDRNLVRIAVGIEKESELMKVFEDALALLEQ